MTAPRTHLKWCPLKVCPPDSFCLQIDGFTCITCITCTCIYIYIHLLTYIHTYVQPARQAGRQTGRQADRQTYRHTDIQTYRHTDIQTYIHTYIYIYIFVSILISDIYIYIHIIIHVCVWFSSIPMSRYSNSTRSSIFRAFRSYKDGGLLQLAQRRFVVFLKRAEEARIPGCHGDPRGSLLAAKVVHCWREEVPWLVRAC